MPNANTNWSFVVTAAQFALALLLPAALVVAAPPPEKSTAPQLIELAKSGNPQLREAIISTFDPKDLLAGRAFIGQGPEFFFVTQSPSKPSLFIDDGPGPEMRQIPSTDLWYASARIERLGTSHTFHYMVGHDRFGGSYDVPVYTPDSYQHPDVPAGKLSDKIVHISKIYDGMKSEYWIYVPAQYDAKTPAALLVVQDGEGYLDRNGKNRTLNVIDNLIAQKKIPVMIAVFINPGDISDSPGTPTYNFVEAYGKKWQRTLKDSMRSTLYDTVSDRYPRFLRDEVLADVASKYNIRKDAYSRSITGLSSGGICSFNAAWQQPDQFSRVISWIGSFSSIQWKEDPANPDGGQDYPDKVLREPKRNIRVWLQDGSEDLDLRYGNWPLANLRMANALKAIGYDFHLSFGRGTHNSAHGAAEFPAEMTWLWRDYDPAKTSQTFDQDPAERTRPPFRVTITNRQDAQ